MTERNAITIIYLLQKKSRELPKVTLIQMTMHCSRSPLWRNTAGLCEVQSRIYVVNRWKYYPDYFPDPLSLSANSWKRAHAIASFKNTPHQKHLRHVAICDECRQEPMSVRFSCRKPVVWSGNIWIRNELSQRAGFIVYGRWTRDGDEDRRVKAWIWVCSSQSYGFWRSGLQHTNKIVSFRNYVAVLVFFMVLLSVTACRRKRCFLWPMANKVNINVHDK